MQYTYVQKPFLLYKKQFTHLLVFYILRCLLLATARCAKFRAAMGAYAPTIHVLSSAKLPGGVNHMKNKLEWFDDNWNWDVQPLTGTV